MSPISTGSGPVQLKSRDEGSFFVRRDSRDRATVQEASDISSR